MAVVQRKRLTANDDLLGNGEDVVSGTRGTGRMIGLKPEKQHHEHDYVTNQGDPAPAEIRVGGLNLRLKEEPAEEREWVNDQRARQLQERRKRITR